MMQVSKFVNTLIEFGEKIQSQLHKKYRPFVKSMLKLNNLAKKTTNNSQSIKLTSEIIVFKLGLESKSIKSIEISLTYLLKLFRLGFVNLSQPNYCQNYEIHQNQIVQIPIENYNSDMCHEFLRCLSPLIHFKNQQITGLIVKIYEFMTDRQILPSLLEISQQFHHEQIHQLMGSYFLYRFHVYESAYCYSKEEIQMFVNLPKSLRIDEQIKAAMNRQENLENLMGKYVEEIVAKVTQEGGKYGSCVICSQPADYFCKATKASLCGIECKNKHLQMTSTEHQNRCRSVNLWQSITNSLDMLYKALIADQLLFLFAVLEKILNSPYLFMLIKKPIKIFISKTIPKILDRVYHSKNQQSYQIIFKLMPNLCKWWPSQCLNEIEYFFSENIFRVLNDKRPYFEHLLLIFKALDEMFQSGKNVIELYVNLDCEINQGNVVGQIIYELSRISQDRFQNSTWFSKQEKITLKNSCVTLFMSLTKGLNQYRLQYPVKVNVAQLFTNKQRKTNLQQFIEKYNRHWSQGIKTLFNLNLVSLQSHHQIIKIILTVTGLNKSMIDNMIFDKNCQHYLEIFMSIVMQEKESLLLKLLKFYQYLPLTANSTIAVKYLIKYSWKYKENITLIKGKQQPNSQQQITEQTLTEQIYKLTNLLVKTKNYEQFHDNFMEYREKSQDTELLYWSLAVACKTYTIGSKKSSYTMCRSQSFLELISSQISLLQIPLSYLLDTNYNGQKMVELIRLLIQICVYSNWLSLLVKNTGIETFKTKPLIESGLRNIHGIMDILVTNAAYIIQWVTVLSFICNLHVLSTRNIPSNSPYKKIQQENKALLNKQFNVVEIDACLIKCSMTAAKNFTIFLKSVILIAREQLQLEHIYMLQKYFDIIDANMQKFLSAFEEIFEEFCRFVEEVQFEANGEVFIYVIGMLKQFLLRVLKREIDFAKTEEVVQKHFLLFKDLLARCKGLAEQGNRNSIQCAEGESVRGVGGEQTNDKEGLSAEIDNSVPQVKLKTQKQSMPSSSQKQVSDFIMNSLSTIIMHHYRLPPKTWKIALNILLEQAQEFPYQTGVIIRKILNEEMVGLVHESETIVNICMLLVDHNDPKSSIQAIHNIKMVLDYQQVCEYQHRTRTQTVRNNQQSQSNPQGQKNHIMSAHQLPLTKSSFNTQIQKLKQLLFYILSHLIQLLNQPFNENVTEVILILLGYRFCGPGSKQAENLLNNTQTQDFINQIFKALQQLTIDQQESGERIMNQILYWCVRNKKNHLIRNLENVIINKYTYLSITALKCLKTYIQMANPNYQTEWQQLQDTLLKIIENTNNKTINSFDYQKLSDLNFKGGQQEFKNRLVENRIQLIDQVTVSKINLSNFAHECRLQAMAVELLPNDLKCLQVLRQAYHNKIKFNDCLELMIALWRKGLGRDTPPQLLSLQQVISNRIMAILLRCKQYQQILDFCATIFQRYRRTSQIYRMLCVIQEEVIAHCDDMHYQYYNLSRNYWEKKRMPMLKLMGYILPKVHKYCVNKQERKKLLIQLSRMLPVLEKREAAIKAMTELAKLSFE